MAEPEELDSQLLAQMREDLFAEAQEILERLGPQLAHLEKDGGAEVINSLFRDLHSLKGGAAFVGLESIRALAHKMEDLFGALRDGRLAVSPEIIDAAYAGGKQLSILLADAQKGGTGEGDIGACMACINALLEERTDQPAAPAANGHEQAPAQQPVHLMSESEGDQQVSDTLRVKVDALDALLALMGELITARNALQATSDRLRDPILADNAVAITRLSRELQNQVSALRLIPVARLFNRFTGAVRNLARESGKQARLVVDGGDTPLDRAISEQIYEPLLHLLRNCIGHGIETPEVRRLRGKPEEGIIKLAAERRDDDVILSISDDGAGIDLARVRRTAVDRGLISGEEASAMNDDQAMALIFAPGFSTSTEVNEMSGRGVGLDVVLQHVRHLRGTVDVRSVLGQGTTFTLRLPLTLAALHVLLVRAGGHAYALPLNTVRETLRLEPSAIQKMQKGELTRLRQVVLPVRRLRGWLSLPTDDVKEDQAAPAVRIHLARGDEVVIVDELIGKQQVVVKPLSTYLGAIPGIAGASVLADGSVALVLEPEGVAV